MFRPLLGLEGRKEEVKVVKMVAFKAFFGDALALFEAMAKVKRTTL